MADCYPPDFSGPLPPGGYYCTPNVPTAFGSINAILQQAGNTATQIRKILDSYRGTTVRQTPSAATVSGSGKVIGLVAIAAVVGLLIWLVWREL